MEQLVATEGHLLFVPLLLQLLVAAGLAHLAAEIVDVAFQFAKRVLDPQEIIVDRFEFIPRRSAAGLVLGDPRGLLQNAPSVLCLLADDFIDHPLFHHRVGARSEPGVHEQILDVEEAAGDLVQEVVAVAGSEQPARDGYLRILDGEVVGGIVDGDRHLGHALLLALTGAGEYHFLHALAPHGTSPLFAEDPTDRLHYIGLAAAVWADDDGDAGTKGDMDLLHE